MSTILIERPRLFFLLLNLWPPLLGAGIRVTSISSDCTTIEAEMRLRWYNRNYRGTHFGGSLFSLCDPFLPLMLGRLLGHDFIVWDKAASIRFRKPGTGTLRAVFHIPEERLEEIRAALETQEKYEPVFDVTVVDGEGDTVAEVNKRMHVRRRAVAG
jgi:hypothetical protein